MMTKKIAVLALTLTLMAATSAMANTFAQVIEVGNPVQITILNTAGTVTITGSSTAGGDNFTFQVATGLGPAGTSQLATFSLTATSTQTGTCGSSTCPNGDSFTEQGFTGSFSYTDAVAGPNFGKILLAGTFNVNATPANSGGKFSSTVGGTGATYEATQTAGNLNGIVMNSAFLDFTGVTVEDGTWAISGLSPAFSVNGTTNGITLPTTGTSFTGQLTGTFSSQNAPGAPEPMTLSLIGGGLIGLALLARRRRA